MARVAGKAGRIGRVPATGKGVAAARPVVRAQAKAATRRAPAARVWTKTRRREFLEQLAATMNVRGSARAIGVSEQSAYRLRARDEDFRAGWRAAIAEAYERLELEMLRRAIGEAAGDAGMDAKMDGGEADRGGAGETVARAGAGRTAGSRAGSGRAEVGARAADSRLAMFLMKMHRETARGARGETDGAGDPTAAGEALEAKLDAMCERMGLAEPEA